MESKDTAPWCWAWISKEIHQRTFLSGSWRVSYLDVLDLLIQIVLNGYLVGWGLGLAVFDGLGVVHSPWKNR